MLILPLVPSVKAIKYFFQFSKISFLHSANFVVLIKITQTVVIFLLLNKCLNSGFIIA